MIRYDLLTALRNSLPVTERCIYLQTGSLGPLSRPTLQAIHDAEELAAGEAEAKTLVAFQHPNIVPVHRYFESNGTGCLVMAFQDGKSLADVIDAATAVSNVEKNPIEFSQFMRCSAPIQHLPPSDQRQPYWQRPLRAASR
mgnify:CR=1 FL=1